MVYSMVARILKKVYKKKNAPLVSHSFGAFVMRGSTIFISFILLSVSSLPLQSLRGQDASTEINHPAASNDDVRTVLSEAKAAALQIKNSFQRGLVLDEIGAAEARAGDLIAALDTAERSYPHTFTTLSAIGEL